jgi:hypothetical protein
MQSHTIEELYKGATGSTRGNRHGRGAAVVAAIDREAGECLFRPELNRRSLQMAEQRRAQRMGSNAKGGILDSVEMALEMQKV